jgi:hypothetical protein
MGPALMGPAMMGTAKFAAPLPRAQFSDSDIPEHDDVVLIV